MRCFHLVFILWLFISFKSFASKDLMDYIDAFQAQDSDKSAIFEPIEKRWSLEKTSDSKALFLLLEAYKDKTLKPKEALSQIDQALVYGKNLSSFLLIELKLKIFLEKKELRNTSEMKSYVSYLSQHLKDLKKWPKIQKRIELTLLKIYHELADFSAFTELFEAMQHAYSDLEKNMAVNHMAFVNYERLGKQPQSLYYGEKVLSDFPLTKASFEVYKKLSELSCQGSYVFSTKALQLMARNTSLKTGSESLIYQLSFEKLRMPDGKVRFFKPMEQLEFLSKLRMYDKAFERGMQLEQDTSTFKRQEEQKELLFFLAEIAFKLKKFRLSLKYTSKYMEQEEAFHPSATELIADNLAYLGYAKDAFRYYLSANNQSPTDLRKWHIFWHKYKHLPQGEKISLKEPPPPRDKEFPEGSIYWQGKWEAVQGDKTLAEKAFYQISSQTPRSIYSSLIKYGQKNIMQAASENEAKTSYLPSDEEEAAFDRKDLPLLHARLARDLISIGEKSLGRDILLDLSKQNEKLLLNENVFHTFQQADIFSILSRHPILSQKKQKKPDERSFLKLRYPLAFDDIIEPICQKIGLDPFIVYSIMRAESFYEEDALSWVGAKGLMQIMPYTAIRIAEQIKDTDFDVTSLSDPMINIAYGSWYLRELIEVFDSNLPLVIAAYNAGPDNVFAWMEKCMNCSLDEMIESISYKETRKYVKNVLSNYLTYKELYEQNPMPILIQNPMKKISLTKKSKIF